MRHDMTRKKRSEGRALGDKSNSKCNYAVEAWIMLSGMDV